MCDGGDQARDWIVRRTSFLTQTRYRQQTIQSLDDAVGLRTLDPSGAVLDLLQLQEQLIGMLIRPAAELAAVVGERGLDLGRVRLEGWDDVGVHQVDGGDRQLVGVEPGLSMATVAVARPQSENCFRKSLRPASRTRTNSSQLLKGFQNFYEIGFELVVFLKSRERSGPVIIVVVQYFRNSIWDL